MATLPVGQTIDVERIKQNVDLRELAARSTVMRKESSRELSGPCPKCGGDDRFHVRADYFFCRHCYPVDNGKPHDAIAYVMWLHGYDFKTACSILSGGTLPTTTTPVMPHQPKAKEPQSDEWRAEAADLVRRAQRLLCHAGHGEPGRDYLTGRGIAEETWESFGLGYMPVGLPGTWDDEAKERIYPKQPAILIPWYQAGQLVAVRYRFLQWHEYTDAAGKERAEKQSSLYGSDFAGILFGEQAHTDNATAFVLCEGELNALSVWQVTKGMGVQVRSLGSQDAKLTPAHIGEITQYLPHVLTWLDERTRAKTIMVALPGARGVQSIDGKDANDRLQSGQLEALIVALLRKTGWAPPSTWANLSWADKLIHCADQLGLTWERLPDGQLWLSRWDDGLIREALALFRQIDAEAAA